MEEKLGRRQREKRARRWFVDYYGLSEHVSYLEIAKLLAKEDKQLFHPGPRIVETVVPMEKWSKAWAKHLVEAVYATEVKPKLFKEEMAKLAEKRNG